MKKFTHLFLLVALTGFAEGPIQAPNHSPELGAKEPQAVSNVIVQWKHKPTEAQHQEVVSRGGVIRRRYSTLSFGAYSLSNAAIQDLAHDPDVAYIAPDRTVHAEARLYRRSRKCACGLERQHHRNR